MQIASTCGGYVLPVVICLHVRFYVQNKKKLLTFPYLYQYYLHTDQLSIRYEIGNNRSSYAPSLQYSFRSTFKIGPSSSLSNTPISCMSRSQRRILVFASALTILNCDGRCKIVHEFELCIFFVLQRNVKLCTNLNYVFNVLHCIGPRLSLLLLCPPLIGGALSDAFV